MAEDNGMKKVVSTAILLLALTSWSCDSQITDILQSVDIFQSKSPYEKGQEAYRRKDYRSALREWQPLAEQGHVRAEFYLGVMYENGRGLPQNHLEASKWYNRAASQNYARAQYNLGLMYAKGQGVPRDHMKAANLYRKAADHGYAKAQYNLGIMYERGRGVSFNHTNAYRWLSLAAMRLPEGKYRDSAVRLRDSVRKKMSPAQIAEGQRLAREWMAKHGKK